MSSEPPFNRLAIVGLGLIGGSIALAVRERWSSVLITAVDRPPVLAHASSSGAIDRAANSVADIGAVDLIVLAAPVHQNIQLLPQVMSVRPSGAIVTDVGGTKRDIVKAAAELPSGTTAFIGGHPIGGAERGGFGFARPDLFRGRPWIFVPPLDRRGGSLEDRRGGSLEDRRGGSLDPPSDPSSPVGKLFDFVRGVGARPATMKADDHDRVMAYVSHLPQLTVSALMEVVGRAASNDGLRFAGRGLTDSTRLASSPASVWRDLCASNADDIAPALDALIARLTELRADLESGRTVEEVFEDAAKWRAELMKGRES
jgi:prephenate dehydrogenase